ncbi:MAG: hypothetical protein ACK56I_02440, partial [bacterium]
PHIHAPPARTVTVASAGTQSFVWRRIADSSAASPEAAGPPFLPRAAPHASRDYTGALAAGAH